MGTPSGSSQWEEIEGDWEAATVKREFGCSARPIGDDHGSAFQLMSPAGGTTSSPSHQGSPAGVRAVLVNTVLWSIAAMTFGFVCRLVPGATPKKPASGLIARRVPSEAMCIQAMSSPTVHTRYPLFSRAETIMARFVFPHALGNAAAM